MPAGPRPRRSRIAVAGLSLVLVVAGCTASPDASPAASGATASATDSAAASTHEPKATGTHDPKASSTREPAASGTHDPKATGTKEPAPSSTHAAGLMGDDAAPVVGQAYGGGKVAYIFAPGDPGYVAGETRGLVAATGDQGTVPWSAGDSDVNTGATATGLGSGMANTLKIIAAQGGTPAAYAAGLARSYTGGGFTDWYLPSKDELNILWNNKQAIGGIIASWYWSSSEIPVLVGTSTQAWGQAQPYNTSDQGLGPNPTGPQPLVKHGFSEQVRAVRTFSTAALAPGKEITAFGLVGPTEKAVIDQAAHTISLTVDVCWAGQVRNSGIAATFATTGASVSVGGAIQVNGLTANTFKPSQVYTVTSSDGTTQAYTVTVDVFIAQLGMDYGGGKIAYILQSGDPGYEACHQHGIIAATSDAGGKVLWSANGDGLGDLLSGVVRSGKVNTDIIIAAQPGDPTAYAAGLARSYTGGGYTDWSLPSEDDLARLYYSQPVIGGMAADWYWTSTGGYGTRTYTAWAENMGNAKASSLAAGGANTGSSTCRVRPVRYF